jgi:hypothetical protein
VGCGTRTRRTTLGATGTTNRPRWPAGDAIEACEPG